MINPELGTPHTPLEGSEGRTGEERGGQASTGGREQQVQTLWPLTAGHHDKECRHTEDRQSDGLGSVGCGDSN